MASWWPRRPSQPPRDAPISQGQREARALGRQLSRTPEDAHPEDPTPGAQQGAPYGAYGLIEPLNDGEIHVRFEELVAKALSRISASHFTFDDTAITQAYLTAVGRGVTVDIVLDAGQSSHASSNSENERIVELLEGGVRVKSATAQMGRRVCHQKRHVFA